MIAFKTIRWRAEKRKGGATALTRLLPKPDAKALAKSEDDCILSEMTKRVYSAGFAWNVIETTFIGWCSHRSRLACAQSLTHHKTNLRSPPVAAVLWPAAPKSSEPGDPANLGAPRAAMAGKQLQEPVVAGDKFAAAQILRSLDVDPETLRGAAQNTVVRPSIPQ